MNHKGQTVIFSIVLIPTLLIVAGVIARTGKALLVHQRLQNHCDKKVLDALAAQAEGLSELGKLNPWARQIIDGRRSVEATLAGASPLALPVLAAEETALRAAQRVIAGLQSEISRSASVRAAAILNRPSVQDVGKSKETFTPNNPALGHVSKQALVLHVSDQIEYQGEVGAPRELDKDFHERQKVSGQISVGLEKYLPWWKGFSRLPDVTVQCEGKVDMESLEDKWKVILVAITDKRSLRAFFPSR